MKTRLTACGAVLCLAVLLPVRAGGEGISAAAMQKHVKFLASDGLVGRETGRHGIRKAEKFIEKVFRGLRLEPPPGHTAPFVDFTLYRTGYDEEATSLALTIGGARHEGWTGADFRPFRFSVDGHVEAPVVFAGYGITASEYGYDDYEGIDVGGKVVLVLRHVPGERDSASSFDASQSHSLFETKGKNAREHGAVAMLLVTDPLNHPPGDDLRVGGALHLDPPSHRPAREFAPHESAPGILALHISRDLAEAMVAPTGRSLGELQRAIDGGRPAAEFSFEGVTAHVRVRASEEPVSVAARNVVGFLKGSDPLLKNEWIVVGAHHDHIGGYPGPGDTVFNGADDNASGVSGVLELARVFADLPRRPRRSILFVTFSGEEKGLLGSRAMVRSQLIPMDRVVFMLNLDMIGRNSDKPVQVYGDGYGRGMRSVIEAANRDVGLRLEFAGAGYVGTSDHDSFYRENIPFAFFSTGIHGDYHRLGDQHEKLDYNRMQSIVEVARGVVERLAGLDELPGFVHHVHWLGVRFESLKEGVKTVWVTGVEDGSRADRAGLRSGDEITHLDTRPWRDPDEVGRRLREIEPETRVTLGVRRGEERLVFSVERARPGYLGIEPGPIEGDRIRVLDFAIGEGVVARRVVEDGPAGRAGLRQGDIVVRIAGATVGTLNLKARLAQVGAGETVDVTVIREGERVTFPVTFGEKPGAL